MLYLVNGFNILTCFFVALFDRMDNKKPSSLCVTLITTPFIHLQMVVNLELIEVWGHENGGEVFLLLLSGIKVSVTASYVMGKCETGVFLSVFYDAR